MILRDRVEVARNEEPGTGVVEIAWAPGRYELWVDAARSAPWTQLTSRVRANWSFQWTDQNLQPSLLAVRFTADLDAHNRAPAGRRVPAGVTVDGGDGGGIVSTVDVSYDDGRTWTSAPLRRDGQRWAVWLSHPRDASFVSLRATARSADGSATVTQEVIRSYVLR